MKEPVHEESCPVSLFTRISNFFNSGEVSTEPVEQEVAAVPIPTQHGTSCETCTCSMSCTCSYCQTDHAAGLSLEPGRYDKNVGGEVDLDTVSKKISRQFTYPRRSRSDFQRGLSLDSRDAEYQFYIRNSIPKGYTRPPRLKVSEQYAFRRILVQANDCFKCKEDLVALLAILGLNHYWKQTDAISISESFEEEEHYTQARKHFSLALNRYLFTAQIAHIIFFQDFSWFTIQIRHIIVFLFWWCNLQAALNRTELNFDGVKYLEAQEQPITLQNTGTDLFEFE